VLALARVNFTVGSLFLIHMKLLLPMFAIIACIYPAFAQTSKVGDCVRRGDIYRDKEYADPLPALRQVVLERARQNRNTFYIAPVCYLDNFYSSTMVYWREGRALILWEPHSKGDEPVQRRHELVWSRRFLLLDRCGAHDK
jgi:hypothetical protein